MQMDAIHPLQIWVHPLGISKISKTDMMISPLKTCDTLLYPHIVSVELPSLEATHFQKYMSVQDVLCNVT